MKIELKKTILPLAILYGMFRSSRLRWRGTCAVQHKENAVKVGLGLTDAISNIVWHVL